MANLADVGKALFGDDNSAVVKAGTLAVTRLTGWVAAAGLTVTNSSVFGQVDLSGTTKLWASVAIVGVFAFIASADTLARGYVTAHSQPDVRPLPHPWKVTIPAKPAAEEEGWRAVLVRFNPQSADDLDFWVVKGKEGFWVKGSELTPA